MKFNKLYMLLAAAGIVGAASCSDVTDPVLQTPDQKGFMIYQSPFENEYFELNEEATFELNLNEQPSYGVSVVTQYRAEVALDPKEFDKEGGLTYQITPTGTGTMLKMEFKQSDMAAAITDIIVRQQAANGVTIEDADQYNALGIGVLKVYFRGYAYVEGAENSPVYTENYVALNNVKSFYYVPKPGTIYVIGNYLGDWIGPDAANAEKLEPYVLSEKEKEVGSKIYYGTIDFQENSPVFRFYSALEGWDANSIGCKTADAKPDSDEAQSFPDLSAGGEFDHDVMNTKNSFSFPGLTGGKLEIKLDLSASTKTEVKGKVYIKALKD